jgi:hypothetical protein
VIYEVMFLTKVDLVDPRWCNEVFWTGLKINPGFIFQRWILNMECFFSFEKWDQESLKIYPMSFFNSFAYVFLSNIWWHRDGEYWPYWILTLLNIVPYYGVLSCHLVFSYLPCTGIYFGGGGIINNRVGSSYLHESFLI